MPKFRIRAWATQTLVDSNDYDVEAPTLQEALRKLAAAQARANDEECWIDIDTGEPSAKTGKGSVDVEIVTPLDPQEVTDGDSGYTQLDPDNDDNPIEDITHMLDDNEEAE